MYYVITHDLLCKVCGSVVIKHRITHELSATPDDHGCGIPKHQRVR